MEKAHFEQAKLWLKAAEYITKEDNKDAYAVGVSMAIHAIIKANDALTMKFLQITARKHDEARALFQDMIKKGKIDSKYSNYKQIIQDAISNKAKAEYRGAFFSKNDFVQMQRKAEKFIKMAEEIVK
jgi:hypothetical protein